MAGASNEAAFGLWHGCPEPGTPASAVRRMLGAPDRRTVEAASPATERWTYRSRQAAELIVRVSSDTVVQWEGAGIDSVTLPPRLLGSTPDVAARVRAYLRTTPTTNATLAYALFNRCVLLGMSEHELLASQGTDYRSTIDWQPSHSRLLSFPIGIEGQALVVTIESSSSRVRAWSVEDARGRSTPRSDP